MKFNRPSSGDRAGQVAQCVTGMAAQRGPGPTKVVVADLLPPGSTRIGSQQLSEDTLRDPGELAPSYEAVEDFVGQTLL